MQPPFDPVNSVSGGSDPRQARVFISYTRKDGAEFASKLRIILSAQDLSIWQDIVALEGGRDWWSQIEDVLKSKALQHFVLVLTPAALENPVVRRELRLARQEGKTISPIKGPGLGDLSRLPRWLGQIYDLDQPEHRITLIRVLQDQSRVKRVAMMAPEPPTDLVQRPLEFGVLKTKLLNAKGDAVAITAALRGAGGYGKTTLAKALAHEPDIQDAYFDGILWVELGEKPDNLPSIISDLITRLRGVPPQLVTLDALASALGEALGDRRILMIIDDVWREQDLRPFLQSGPNTTRLITTRIDKVLPADATRQSVDAMQDREALDLLVRGLPVDQIADQRSALRALVVRLGEWPLLLKIVNGFLRERVVRSHQPLAQAIAGANKRLAAKGLVAFDPRNADDRSKAVASTIGVSLELLNDSMRASFSELGIFQDTDIPIGIVAELWAKTGKLDEVETEDLLSDLHGLSLLLDLDLNQRTLRLHDTVRRFLQDQTEAGKLAGHRKILVQVLESIRESENVDALSRRYCYLNLPQHLADANDREALDALLLDPSWLMAKLAATGNTHALVADYDRHAVGETENLIGRTLRLTAGICARDQRQLIPQLLSRLGDKEGLATTRFVDAARLQLRPPAILAHGRGPSAAETARLEGHSANVNTLCVLPDGRIASGAADGTIRLWDVGTGAEVARLEVHGFGGVGALCVLPDGKLASGNSALRIWNLETGEEVAGLEGHSHALCVLADGRLASGSKSGIQLWDVKAVGKPAALDCPSNAFCLLPDGRLASACADFIQLLDVDTGAETRRLEGHTRFVNALCVLSDGRLASGSNDNTIRLWDVNTGAETARLEGRPELAWEVVSLCVLPDGRLASGSEDYAIRLWDVETCTVTGYLEGHSGSVTALCVLPDGRLASGSKDGTIRLWNVREIQIAFSVAESGATGAMCVLPDGRLASGSWDSTIRLWDVKSGAETARLRGHSGYVSALCVLFDKRLASGSDDHTIRLWDVATGTETDRLEGHSEAISALRSLPDGRLASVSHRTKRSRSQSDDSAIRLWNVQDAVEITRLGEGSNPIKALCALPDGRLAAASEHHGILIWDANSGAATPSNALTGDWVELCVLPDDRLAYAYNDTIRLWDVRTGKTDDLEGHSGGGISALSALRDGRLVSSARDNTIRLWDVVALREVTRLEFDAMINSIVVLSDTHLVASDTVGHLHWLEIVN
jgi:WD40 repeat protein